MNNARNIQLTAQKTDITALRILEESKAMHLKYVMIQELKPAKQRLTNVKELSKNVMLKGKYVLLLFRIISLNGIDQKCVRLLQYDHITDFNVSKSIQEFLRTLPTFYSKFQIN